MTTELGPTVTGPGLMAHRVSRSRPVLFGAAVLRQVLAEPVAAGRLRDVGWPHGLAALVALGYGMFALAALGVVGSSALRSQSVLVINGNLGVGTPAGLVGPLVLLLSFGAASLLTAAVHGPWWLKVLGLLFGLMIMGSWSLRGARLTGLGWLAAGAALMLGLVVFVILRWRRAFAWWEFAVAWSLVGGAMVVGVMQSRASKTFGFDFNVLLLQQTAALLGFLALPTAMVAGAAVAEVTVRASVSAVRQAQRLSHHRWPYVILAVVIAVRGVQAGLQLADRDPVSGGIVAVAPAAAIVAGFAGIGLLVLRLGRGQGGRPVVTELSDELGSVGLAIAAAILAVQVPIQLWLAVLQVGTALAPNGPFARARLSTTFVGDAVDPLRIVIGVVLVVLAVRYARRGRSGRALVLGCVGVMLMALARNLVLPDTTARIDPDVLNLVASSVVLGALVVALARRRLTTRRALAFAGVLTLSALFSSRDFISDPLGFLLGFSGAALVLFGLTWDLLTGSGWGNGESARFPRPTRVLLVLTNSVLAMTVLAYAALIRDGSTTIYLDVYAEFGDLIFGTALLAAAVIAVLDTAARDVPVE